MIKKSVLNTISPCSRVRLTLSRSLRSAILLVTSSWAKSSFSCSNLMFASCKRLFSRLKIKRNQLQTHENESFSGLTFKTPLNPMEIVGGITGPMGYQSIISEKLMWPYQVAMSFNSAKMPPNCNKLGRWFEAKQTLFSYLQTQTETWISKRWRWILKGTQQGCYRHNYMKWKANLKSFDGVFLLGLLFPHGVIFLFIFFQLLLTDL